MGATQRLSWDAGWEKLVALQPDTGRQGATIQLRLRHYG
jgi:hypothetical protein